MEVLYVIILVFCAITFVQGINTVFKFPVKPTTFPAIEGLRGFLAVFVVIHHIFVWHQYINTGVWKMPDSNLLAHFGRTSVAFFFMITAFLFIHKLISSDAFQWSVFFRNRFLRIFPLYFFCVLCMVFIIFGITGFDVKESINKSGIQIGHWLMFTYFDSPLINLYQSTNHVTAGVFWSLRYEWLFYLSIPVIGVLFFRKKAGAVLLFLSTLLCGVFFLVDTPSQPILLLNFIGGGIVACLIYKVQSSRFMQSALVTWAMLIVTFVNIYGYYNSNNLVSILLQTLVFIPMVYGNTIFGLMNLRAVQVMGQISYSIYLLHGLLLFLMNEILISKQWLSTLSIWQYCLLGMASLFVVLFMSFITYKYIEKPALRWKKV